MGRAPTRTLKVFTLDAVTGSLGRVFQSTIFRGSEVNCSRSWRPGFGRCGSVDEGSVYLELSDICFNVDQFVCDPVRTPVSRRAKTASIILLYRAVMYGRRSQTAFYR